MIRRSSYFNIVSRGLKKRINDSGSVIGNSWDGSIIYRGIAATTATETSKATTTGEALAEEDAGRTSPNNNNYFHHHRHQQIQQRRQKQHQEEQRRQFSSSLNNSIGSSSTINTNHRVFPRYQRHQYQQKYQQQHQQLLQQQRQQIRTVFIQTENTPNPESIKFLPTNTIVLDNKEDGSSNGHFLKKNDPTEEILKSPLAKNLFKIDGVKAVYFGYDFVTVTKYATGKWQFMRPEIFSVLMDFFDNPDNVVVLDQPVITDTTILDDDDEIVAMIKELIEDRIRPAVQEDGGDIRYVSWEEDTGLVTVQLAGSCVGCPSSSVTLKQGVENMLMHYIPEVTAVQATEEEEEEDDDGMIVDEIVIDKSVAGNNNNGHQDDDESSSSSKNNKQQKSYEERLAAAGIPFSD